jgi:hypothetical protein
MMILCLFRKVRKYPTIFTQREVASASYTDLVLHQYLTGESTIHGPFDSSFVSLPLGLKILIKGLSFKPLNLKI